MKRNIIVIIIGLILLTNHSSVAQVYIGDKIPDLTIEDVLYVEDNRINTKSFMGKATLIEFGTTYCGPCMESLKKMNVFKALYGDEIDFYMVTPQRKTDVENFFGIHGLDSLVDVPVITNDSILKATFRHVAIPHLVWINKEGRVVAVTNHQYLEKNNIDDFLNGQKLEWPVKWDFPYDGQQHMLIFNPVNFREVNKPKRYYSSVVTDHLEGILKDAGIRIDSIMGEKIVYGRNLTFLHIYLRHLSRNYNSDFFASQVVVDSLDRNMYFHDTSQGTAFDWHTKNTYSYEFVFPSGFSAGEINEAILKQFDVYFGRDVSLKTIERPCWVLYYAPHARKLNVKDHPKARNVSGLLRAVNRIPFHKPLVLSEDFDKELLDEIQFLLDSDHYADLIKINNDLAPYGLHIREQDHHIESLIIEKN